MRTPEVVFLVSIYVRACLGNVLEVIDHGGQCLIWSDDNHGCTGYSAPLGLLDGDDCSALSEVVDGHRKAEAVVSVDACGTENGQPAAWIVVNDKGLVTFFNQNGDRSACALDNGLRVGSQCIASMLGSASSSTPSGSPASDSGPTSSVSGSSSASGSSTSPWPGKTPASATSHKAICGV